MDITMYGAAQEVTGSCYLVESGTGRLLIDCGMFQGSDRLERLNKIPKSLISKKINAVLLTHGHLDHCGRLPLLVKAGYRGPIYATDATLDIARLIMEDSARIQQDDTDRENRKRHKSGQPEVEPLYTTDDVERVAKLFHPISYNRSFEVISGIGAEYVEAGHILGSGSIELTAGNNGKQQLLVFSGDLGQWNVPILRDPARIDKADMVFCESTYGDREHRPYAETIKEFQDLIKGAAEKKSKVLIPSFAIGRAQQILYNLAEMYRNGIVTPMPVYLDSPMAIAATELYGKHQSLMDEEAEGQHHFAQMRADLRNLQLCVTAEESKALNEVDGPCIILAGAGMCNAGRIMHHLRHNLGNASTLVIIVGYQAKGSVGRQLIEGAQKVKMFGETIVVRATVRGLGGFSAHAGQSDLLKWLEPMARSHSRIVLTHGESQSQNELAFQIKQRFGVSAEIPKLGDKISI
jgi:metallo-beta-lactamase family protein